MVRKINTAKSREPYYELFKQSKIQTIFNLFLIERYNCYIKNRGKILENKFDNSYNIQEVIKYPVHTMKVFPNFPSYMTSQIITTMQKTYAIVIDKCKDIL